MLEVNNRSHIKALAGDILLIDTGAGNAVQTRKEGANGNRNCIENGTFSAAVVADENGQIGIQLGMEILESPKILDGDLIDLHGVQPFPITEWVCNRYPSLYPEKGVMASA